MNAHQTQMKAFVRELRAVALCISWASMELLAGTGWGIFCLQRLGQRSVPAS